MVLYLKWGCKNKNQLKFKKTTETFYMSFFRIKMLIPAIF
jgi:hypothetical protein